MIPAEYLSPEEAAAADLAATDKALGAVISTLITIRYEMDDLKQKLNKAYDNGDEEKAEDLEDELKFAAGRERSFQRVMSGLQSRLRGPNL